MMRVAYAGKEPIKTATRTIWPFYTALCIALMLIPFFMLAFSHSLYRHCSIDHSVNVTTCHPMNLTCLCLVTSLECGE